MDNITFEAMPQAISELIQKVDTLQSTVAALQKHCNKPQLSQAGLTIGNERIVR